MIRTLLFSLLGVAAARHALAVVELSPKNCDPSADVCALGGPGHASGAIEPGETGSIVVSVQNQGDEDATGVTATVSSFTPGVTVTQPSSSFGTVLAGATKPGTTIDVSFADTMACGTVVSLDMRLFSDQGSFSGSCQYSIPVACVPCAPGPTVTTATAAHADTCALGGPGHADAGVDPGESIQLTLSLTNTGTLPATGVIAQVASPTPGVTITQPNASFGTIAAGATVAGAPVIAYTVDLSVPCATAIDFIIDVRSDQGTWLTGAQVQVPDVCTPCTSGPSLAVAACAVADSCSLGGAGHANGAVDPGESVQSLLSLTNSGQGVADLVTAQVSTSTPGVTVTVNSASFGSIAAGATVVGSPAIAYSVDASVACGTPISFVVDIKSTQQSLLDSCGVTVAAPCNPCVAAPVVDVESCVLATDVCALGGSASGNGQPDPGEDATVVLTLRNGGLGPATAVNATVTTLVPGILISQGTSSFGTLAPSASASGTPDLALSVDLAVGCGTAIDLEVDIATAQGNFKRTCALAVPGNCTACGSTTCVVSGLAALRNLTAVESGTSGARFAWSGGGGVETHVNAVVARTSLSNCAAPCTATPRQAPAGMGELRCTALPPSLSCLDAVAISDPRPLLYYQALAACGSTGSDEGPM